MSIVFFDDLGRSNFLTQISTKTTDKATITVTSGKNRSCLIHNGAEQKWVEIKQGGSREA